jgi:DNA-damage-inducible protein D
MKRYNYKKMNDSTTVLAPKKVRKVEHNGEMFYSIVDIIEKLTGTVAPRTYWAMLKKRNFELLKLSEALNIPAADGKSYTTEATNKAGILRILTAMPSPELEPFKSLFLATKKGNSPDDVIELPEIQGVETFSNEASKTTFEPLKPPSTLTKEWQQRGIEGNIEFAILDATISKWTFDLTPTEHKELKGLTTQKLSSHFTSLELIFKALAEEATRDITINRNAQGFIENVGAAQIGGKLAGDARRNLEESTGIKVVSSENRLGK